MPSTLQALKSLFLGEWDPLGLSNCDGAEGHYEPYADRVFEMLAQGADAVVVASYLSSVVTSEMSLTANLECDRAIATKAVAIHKSAQSEATVQSPSL